MLLGLVVAGFKLSRTQTSKEVETPSEEEVQFDQGDELKMSAIGAEHLLRSMGKPVRVAPVWLPFFDGHGLTFQQWQLPQAPPDPYVQFVGVGDGSVPTDEELEALASVIPIEPLRKARRPVIPPRLRPTGTDVPQIQQR
jgi:hypothetical protein